jgi:hypothetical protein
MHQHCHLLLLLPLLLLLVNPQLVVQWQPLLRPTVV